MCQVGWSTKSRVGSVISTHLWCSRLDVEQQNVASEEKRSKVGLSPPLFLAGSRFFLAGSPEHRLATAGRLLVVHSQIVSVRVSSRDDIRSGHVIAALTAGSHTDRTGMVLDHWTIMSPEDELITLQQFLRFGETKSSVEQMMEEQRAAGDMCRDLQTHTHNLSDVFLQPFLSPSPALSLHHHLTHDNPRTPIRDEVEPPKSCHLNHQGLMEVDSSVPDSSSSSSAARERRHGSSGKSRVSCNACAKTFYDKGTLKIHFNAVHLKIKHLCTIEGCNMMFSSLRSRNRHSANPNPRLHTPLPSNTPRHTSRPSNTLLHGSHHVTHPSKPRLHTPHHVTRPSNPPPIARNCSTFELFLSQPILNPSPPVLPGHTTAPTVTSNTGCHRNSGGGRERGLNDATVAIPKKKPRKSSTPLKFKRECRHDNRCDDDEDEVNRGILLPTESVNDFHSNQSHQQAAFQRMSVTTLLKHLTTVTVATAERRRETGPSIEEDMGDVHLSCALKRRCVTPPTTTEVIGMETCDCLSRPFLSAL
ncbi:Zinc finger protein basonuclin-2 [Triplophysa tibetana]|uniref:Zinc finger protein basonuclin-2 n=1 Tax=Triplophysa tibetana TaxID=1572043 RepID=A0A5A9NBL6_9TELE|nr:Zinc finger protein basonuclin-2 [Triplophysa tibetana]